MGNPTSCVRRHFFNPGYWHGLPKENVITREENSDYMSGAPNAAGAIRVEPHECRIRNRQGDLECPLAGRKYKVGELTPHPAQENGCHNWLTGMRLRPDADDSRSQIAHTVFAAPPGVRRTSVRGLIAFGIDGSVGGDPSRR